MSKEEYINSTCGTKIAIICRGSWAAELQPDVCLGTTNVSLPGGINPLLRAGTSGQGSSVAADPAARSWLLVPEAGPWGDAVRRTLKPCQRHFL